MSCAAPCAHKPSLRWASTVRVVSVRPRTQTHGRRTRSASHTRPRAQRVRPRSIAAQSHAAHAVRGGASQRALPSLQAHSTLIQTRCSASSSERSTGSSRATRRTPHSPTASLHMHALMSSSGCSAHVTRCAVPPAAAASIGSACSSRARWYGCRKASRTRCAISGRRSQSRCRRPLCRTLLCRAQLAAAMPSHMHAHTHTSDTPHRRLAPTSGRRPATIPADRSLAPCGQVRPAPSGRPPRPRRRSALAHRARGARSQRAEP
jgi:hypothetical protein